MREVLRRPQSMKWIYSAWDVITGCTPISEGCDLCIARKCKIRSKDVLIHNAKFLLPTMWPSELKAPYLQRSPTSILIAPRGDLFHESFQESYVHEVLDVVRAVPKHEYYLLTKRPKRMLQCLQSYPHWPLPRINVGVSAETQQRLLERLPTLLSIPVLFPAFRYLSLEPMLGSVCVGPNISKLGWIVYGEERGTGKRLAQPEWFASVREEAQRAGVPSYHHYTHVLEHQQKPPTDMRFQAKLIRTRLREYERRGTQSLIESFNQIVKRDGLSTRRLGDLIQMDQHSLRNMLNGETISEQNRLKAVSFVEENL